MLARIIRIILISNKWTDGIQLLYFCFPKKIQWDYDLHLEKIQVHTNKPVWYSFLTKTLQYGLESFFGQVILHLFLFCHRINLCELDDSPQKHD
jgi:hypothetical protein